MSAETLDAELESLDQGCERLLNLVLEQAGYPYHPPM